MSTYPHSPPAVPAVVPSRPVTVALAMWGGLVVGLLSLVGAVVAIVLMFLPATNRYAAARKLARR